MHTKSYVLAGLFVLALLTLLLPLKWQNKLRNEVFLAQSVQIPAYSLEKIQAPKLVLTNEVTKQAMQTISPQAWVIQVGSFIDQQNAQKLVEELREQGFAGFMQTSLLENSEVSRVFIGPEVEQVQAEQLLTKLDDKLAKAAVITRYQPLSDEDTNRA